MARGTEEGVTGVLLVDKPAGPTSHDIVSDVRRALRIRRVGHAGTLDPFATGLLLLCVGHATRLVRYLHLLDKRYSARLRLGAETSTHDPEGEVVSRSEGWRRVGRDDLQGALASFVGEIEQVPPAFSAVRVEGRRAHRVARAGGAVELEPRRVRVASLRLAAFEAPEAEVEAVVGTGTYVRALARDLGRRLGCGAHLVGLRRTEVGPFGVERALAPGEVAELGPGGVAGSTAWLSPAEALAWLPARDLSEDEVERVRHGGRVAAGLGAGNAGAEAGAAGFVALLHEGELVAVAERADGSLQPRTVLVGA